MERNYSVAIAGTATSAYWGALTIGRIGFGQILVRRPKAGVLTVTACIAVVACLMLGMKTQWSLDLVGAALLGLALAPVFPTWISITPDYVGQSLSATSIGLQMASAAIGAATFPLVVGQLAGSYTFAIIPVCLLVGAVAVLVLQVAIFRNMSKIQLVVPRAD